MSGWRSFRAAVYAPDEADELVALLKARGHEATALDQDSLAPPRGRADRPSLLVVAEVPGLDVLALARHLRRIGEARPLLLVLTPRAAPEELAALAEAGVDGFLTWPRDRALLPARLAVLEHAVEERRAGSEFLRNVLDTVPDPIFVKDEQHRWIVLNDAYCRFLGHSREELYLKSDFDFFPAHEAQVFWEKDALVFSTGLENENEETFTDASGRTHNIITRKAVSTDAEGRKILVGTIRDVSERKRMEAQLVLSDRLAVVGTLAAGVAHEINTPLGFLLGNLSYVVEQLAAGAPVSEELRAALAEALDGAKRVRAIVQDMKTFSRPDEERRVPVDVARVLEVCVRMIGNPLRYRGRLVRAIDADLPPVEATEARLGQVFLNLLVNALHALPERDPAANRITVRATVDEERRVVVEVGDNGAGIPAHIRSRIFDPFFTTKPVGVGSGLGLSICHGIVTALGGSISVESEAGQGTTFRVALPAWRRTSPSPTPTAIASVSARAARILVIDDEPLVGAAVRRMLGAGYEVVSLNDAREALAPILDGRFDLVLCDLMMPGMTGMELHAEVARARPEMAARLAFVTGGAFTPRAQEFIDSVDNPHLSKPFASDELRNFVKSILG